MKAAPHDQMRLLFGRRIIALALDDMRSHIGANVCMHECSAWCKRLLQIHNGRQRFKIHIDVLHCVFGNVAALRDDKHNRFARVAHLVFC